MRSSSGFTLFELLVVMLLVAVLAGVAVPVLMDSTAANRVWTASETIGAQIRQARLKAISRNMSFRVRFDCPQAGQFRVLVVTGDAAIDNDANRCTEYREFDSGVYAMPDGVSYGDQLPILTVNSRGVFSSTTGIPATISVSHATAGAVRSLDVSATGQITFEDVH